ncbi:MAG TPA: NAD-dependent epimerase/dehydratase family protein [Vicinamibacterales bacterium]|jgi:nucleoside-diphosphate-sugar epimerase
MTARARIGVTGATGQVGSRLLRHLHAAGCPVVAAVRNPLAAALCDAAVPGCEIRIGSLVPEAGARHVLDDCDVLINCALESSGGIPRQAYARNRRLIDGLFGARALKWLVHFSTVAVYGELIAAHADPERARRHPHPTSEYGRSKLFVERYAARRAAARGIDCTVLRLGHVYGAGIARSREIIELAQTAAFRLPFGGRLPSNAIHQDGVGAAIVGLLAGGPRRSIESLAEPAHSWRDVFDWHTGVLGLPPIRSMDDQESAVRRDTVAGASIPREALAWLQGLPIKALVRSPATFDLALRILANTPDGITKRVSDANRRAGARAQIACAEASMTLAVPPLYLSSGMPGPFCDVPPPSAGGLGSAAERARELREWHELWSMPRTRAAMMMGHGAARLAESREGR